MRVLKFLLLACKFQKRIYMHTQFLCPNKYLDRQLRRIKSEQSSGQ